MKTNILLVEYDSDIVDAVTALFHPDIVEFSVAGNDVVAKALLNKEKYDMVITEALLPKSHGFLISKYISENFPKTKVIILTEKIDEIINQDEMLKYGACELIKKPLDKEKFLERVLYHLNVLKRDQMGEGFVQDTTKIYMIPYLEELKAMQSDAGIENNELDEIIKKLKESETGSYKIELD
jgi:DNA-binding response OmpR family regulator